MTFVQFVQFVKTCQYSVPSEDEVIAFAASQGVDCTIPKWQHEFVYAIPLLERVGANGQKERGWWRGSYDFANIKWIAF